MRVGQISSIVLGVLACLWAPMIRSFDGVFNYIQELWGLVSIPTVAVMVTGRLWRRVPPLAAHIALFLGPALYLLARLPSWIFKGREEAIRADGGLSAFALRWSEIHYLHHFFGIAFFLCGLMVLITSLRPLPAPRALPLSLAPIDLTPWAHARKAGIALTAVVLLLYVLLW